MTRRKLEEKNIRKLGRRGNSYIMSVPIEIVRELGWREKQKIQVKRIHGGFTVRDWKNN